jgi:hypothetical protein
VRRSPFAALVVTFALAALAMPSPSLAQRRGGGGPPSGGGTTRPPAGGYPSAGHAVPRPAGHYSGYYPYYAHGYYGGYWPWFGVGWWGAYPWYGYPPPYYYAADSSGVRLQVTPRETEVYVDGSLAGIVDDFDGTFQRLNLPAGEHEIELYLQGHKSVRQKILLTRGSTYRIKHVMQPLAPGEPQDPRPEPAAPPPVTAPPGPGPDEQFPGPIGRQRPGWGEPAPPAVSSNFGTLSIRVQPTGADVFIDGERWQGPDGQQRLIVEVAEGAHRVEIRKDGYESFTANVTVRRGDVTPLNVSLLAREN